MDFTGERYLSDMDQPEISYEHWHRYLYATQFVKDKVVLDIACGEGYGAFTLAKHANKVIGVDIAQEAISYAASKYFCENLELRLGSATAIPVEENNVFDVITSFETIEHISEEDQKKFLSEVKRLLKPDGLFIVSTPNKEIYTLPNYHSEYHIKEFYLQEYKDFLGKSFEHVTVLGQRIYPVSYIWNPYKERGNLIEYRLQYTRNGFEPTDAQKKILYAIAVCSNSPIDDQHVSVMVDISERMISQREEKIRQQAHYIHQLTPHYNAQLFIDTGLGFNKNQFITLSLEGNEEKIEFDISGYRGIKALRFDPLNDIAALHLNSVELIDENKCVIPVTEFQSPECHQNGKDFVFETSDPRIIFDAPDGNYQKIVISLNYVALGRDAYPFLLKHKNEALTARSAALRSRETAQIKLSAALKTRETEQARLTAALDSKEAELAKVKAALGVKEAELKNVKSAIHDREAKLAYVKAAAGKQAADQNRKIQQANQQLADMKNMLNRILSSSSWKVTMPLRWVRRNINPGPDLSGLGPLPSAPGEIVTATANPLANSGKALKPAGKHTASLNPKDARILMDRILSSPSWKLTAPLRRMRRHLRVAPSHMSDALRLPSAPSDIRPDLSPMELQNMINRLLASSSWKVSAPLRWLRRNLRFSPPVSLGRLPAAPVAVRVPIPLQQNKATTAKTVKHQPAIKPVSTASDENLKQAWLCMASFVHNPLISIVIPTYNTDPALLNQLVTSIKQQIYTNWELCICDDGSTRKETLACLRNLDVPKDQFRLVITRKNRGISKASNTALDETRGEFVAFVDHDDLLTSDALFEVARVINEFPDTDVVYTDQDKVDMAGKFSTPFYKPDFSPEYLRGVMYVGHLLVVRRDLALELNGFDPAFDTIQDYEFMLRVSERTQRIRHVAKILYHWRKVPGSYADSLSAKLDNDKLSTLQEKAVNAHLERLNIRAEAKRHPTIPHRIMILPSADAEEPLVSVIIPTLGPDHLDACLESLFSKSTYKNLDVILVDNNPEAGLVEKRLEKFPDVRVIPCPEPFNFARLNNLGAREARGEYLLLLNDDTELVEPGSLSAMAMYLSQPDVGAVGPLLLYPDLTVQHAGVVLGFRGTADHVMRGFPKDSDGYAGSLSCAREVSAVTAACLMVRKTDYFAAGEMKESYTVVYQDVDFCLRLRELGRRNIYTPRAVFLHHESKSRGKDYPMIDRALLIDCFGRCIRHGDPYYNSNFNLARCDYACR
ncbi:MAG: glycosyltransferase [Desulfobacteraceae bacterium]|jgi:GT2 family glycosyltransferase/ubiquinone/menaquinone biosynthesis C-methylase UbiE|nr:glycosyltransferase [Desulfobacteraceae bacterium]